MKILSVVGARPQFIKLGPLSRELRKRHHEFIIHTGQHYDNKMSNVFFEQFRIAPDFWLNISGGSPNSQIAAIMQGLEDIVQQKFKPDLLIVVGDVNSTLAAAIAANKMNIPLAHVESGLRSRDRGMPEEINRILTDEITDYFFVTEQSGYDNLLQEGKAKDHIFFVGNTMIDTLVAFDDEIEKSAITDQLGVQQMEYALMTMHRPATVDQKETLLKLLTVIRKITERTKLVFPVHPRTENKLKHYGLWDQFSTISNLIPCPPIGYFEFQKLIKESAYVVTDSGGIQEETTFRQVPCLTLRPNTERPSTIDIGTNTLLPFDIKEVDKYLLQIENGTYKKGKIPPKWDGKATERIVETLQNKFV